MRGGCGEAGCLRRCLCVLEEPFFRTVRPSCRLLIGRKRGSSTSGIRVESRNWEFGRECHSLSEVLLTHALVCMLGLSALWLAACSSHTTISSSPAAMSVSAGSTAWCRRHRGKSHQAISDDALRDARASTRLAWSWRRARQLHTHGEQAVITSSERWTASTMLDTERGRSTSTSGTRTGTARRSSTTASPPGARRARAGGWRQMRGLSFLSCACQRSTRTDRSNRRARPPRARAPRALGVSLIVLHAGGH